jgi:hypothetical protein
MISLLTLPFRLAFGSVRLGWRTGRLVGPSRALFFGIGFGLGVVAASPSARRVAVKAVAKGVATAKAAADEPPATEPTVGVATTD